MLLGKKVKACSPNYPLTHPQKRIWYIEKIYPHTSMFNIGGTIRIKGRVDLELLAQAIRLFVMKNEGVRLRFIEKNGVVSQYVSEYKHFDPDLVQFQPAPEPEAEFAEWVRQEAEHPFETAESSLFYFALFTLSDEDQGYFVKFHHLIADGWSIQIMTREISSLYMELLNKHEINGAMNPSYTLSPALEEQYLSSERFRKNKQFWNMKFGAMPESSLQASSPRLQSSRMSFDLGKALSERIRQFTQGQGVSLNTFFVAVFFIQQHKIQQQDDLIIGTPVANRSGKLEKSIFGMFTSTMPLRFRMDGELTLMELLKRVYQEIKNCYFNQKYPYDLLIKDLAVTRSSQEQLFTCCVNYYNTKLNSLLNGAEIENVEFHSGYQMYSLQLVIKDWSAGLTLDLDYKVNDYTPAEIQQLFEQLQHLINQMLDHPELAVREVQLMHEKERKGLIYEINSTTRDFPGDKSIIRLFEEQVLLTPCKTAVEFQQSQITYRALNEKANQLARKLQEQGGIRGQIIGLMTGHSTATVIAILAVLKAGACYLPIDSDSPPERINYMLRDSGASLLLIHLQSFEGISFEGKIIDLADPNLYTGDASNLQLVSHPSDLAYLIYTSGSTGRPKGTMIEQQGLVNYIWWAKKTYVRTEDEVFPFYSNIAFDLTVTSIFTPLISGGKIIVYTPNSYNHVIYDIMEDNKSTVLKLTPAHLSLLQYRDNKQSSIKRFIVGGEELQTALARNITETFSGQQVEIWNEYGPTEATVGCMIHKFNIQEDTGASVPIGKPIDNVQIYILDQYGVPLPENTTGDLYISGAGIARGYLNNQELTDENFMSNPFVSGSRLYRTGDLARFIGNGNMEYVGRKDHQLKIRGYRIERSEIEKHLLDHASVHEAVVIDRESASGGKYLCGYVVLRQDVSFHDLRQYLLVFLPDYMVPEHFVAMEGIPLTANGKINRNLLPDPRVEPDIAWVSPRTGQEQLLVQAISEVMEIERVGMKQNFFLLGGDSIKAIQVAARLYDKGYSIKVRDILSHPVIEEMSLCVVHHQVRASQGISAGSIKPSPIISWFLSQDFVNPNHYNQSILVILKQSVVPQELERVMKEIIKHHDSLRINVNSGTGELFYNNRHLERPFLLERHDLSMIPLEERAVQLSSIGHRIKASFDLGRDLLLKAALFQFDPKTEYLLLTAHHLVVDGISWAILAEDILHLLRQSSAGMELKLATKTISYQEWTQQVQNRVIHVPEVVRADNYGNSGSLARRLSREQTHRLLTEAHKAYSTNTLDILAASLILALNDTLPADYWSLDLESHGRDDAGEGFPVTRTVGWFTDIFTVRFELKDEALDSILKSVKEQIRDFAGRERSGKQCCESGLIKLNYLGDFTSILDNEFFKYADVNSGMDYCPDNHLSSPIEINAMVTDGQLDISITFSSSRFNEEQIINLADMLVHYADVIIEYCCSMGEMSCFTPSDFQTVAMSQEALDNLFQ